MQEKKYPKFCILPWMHLFVSTTGTLRPCCVSKEFDHRYKIQKEGIREFWNSTHMRELRLAMLNGEEPKVCSVCWDKEVAGDNYSKRLGELSIFKNKIDVDKLIEHTDSEGRVDDNIVSYDLRLGNLCNLKCVMCNPNSSSKWLEDKEIIGKYENTGFSKYSIPHLKWPTSDELWNHIYKNYSNIQLMHFAGGEPLLHKKHYELLEFLVETGQSKHIFLKYNSNITVIPDRTYELWSKFKRVDIWSSIDGLGELNDYIRYPSKWSEILNSLECLDNTHENVNVRINTTISALNVEYVPDLYNFIINQNYKKIGKGNWYEGTHISPDLVYDPIFLSVKILPSKIKQRITDKLQNHIDAVSNEQYKAQLTYVISYMNSEDLYEKQYSTFLNYIDDLNKIRKNSYPYDIYRPNQ